MQIDDLTTRETLDAVGNSLLKWAPPTYSPMQKRNFGELLLLYALLLDFQRLLPWAEYWTTGLRIDPLNHRLIHII